MSEYKIPKNQEELLENFGQIKPLMSPNEARLESSRCLYCYDAPCVTACPTGIDIPLFIKSINSGNIVGAAQTIYESNVLGNSCGKVCPTEVLCEGACVYNHQDVKPIEIGRLQSHASTHVLSENISLFTSGKPSGRKVAVIGAGPAGISAACDLRMHGHEVEIFEAKSKPTGLLYYGVAPYKITNQEALHEVEWLQSQLQFEIHYNSPVSDSKSFSDLEDRFDAVLLAVGLGDTRMTEIEGEDLENCIGATEYIEQVKTSPFEALKGQKVVIIGGGNTAMDAASESARLGADEVYLVYRRSKEEMGAYGFEYDLARNAGVQGVFNAQPHSILGEEKVESLLLDKTASTEKGVEIVEGSSFMIECDMVILATGQSKRKELAEWIHNLKLDDKGRVEVHAGTFQTSNPKFFAAGDAVNGGMEVVNAVAEGKLAARGIHQFLSI